MGPMEGLRVVEFAGLGPAPHAAMMLGDWGADVVRIARPGPDGAPDDMHGESQLRNRTVTAADLKNADSAAEVLELIGHADVLIEGYRPGVLDKHGLGPDRCLTVNEGLIYARMTGWGQDGPRARTAGHDINYLSVTGMLHAIGGPDEPTVPLNLVGDFGGGSMFLLSAILAALFERNRSGRGQVLDVAIIDGVTTIAQQVWSIWARGGWNDRRTDNLVDGGSPIYGVYECADGRFMAVGAIERKFSAELFTRLGLDPSDVPDLLDRTRWAELRKTIAEVFRSKTREDWVQDFADVDACITPVLSMAEALEDPQIRARKLFGEVDGLQQTLPAQVFGRSASDRPKPPNSRSCRIADVIADWAARR